MRADRLAHEIEQRGIVDREVEGLDGEVIRFRVFRGTIIAATRQVPDGTEYEWNAAPSIKHGSAREEPITTTKTRPRGWGLFVLALMTLGAAATLIAHEATASSCNGSALTQQAQVQANTAYCGGTANQQIRLADGDTWTNGEVTGSGISTSQQRGALECSGNCALVNMNVHNVPNAFAAFYAPGAQLSRIISISGGRFSGAGSLGIGPSRSTFTLSGAEIDHNGATASCGFEGGGVKWVGNGTIDGVNAHDNKCPGLWSDINGGSTISNSTLTNNGSPGIAIEISSATTHIFGNTLSNNGHQDANGCGWYWDSDIEVSTASNVEIDHNTLNSSCNGITAIEQNRPGWLTRNIYVHDNQISLTGNSKVGFISDNGDQGIYNVASNRFVHNTYVMPDCNRSAFSWQGTTHTFAQWQALGQDVSGSCGTALPTGPPSPTPTASPTATPSGSPTPTATPAGYSGTCTVTVVNGTVTGGNCKP